MIDLLRLNLSVQVHDCVIGGEKKDSWFSLEAKTGKQEK